MSLGTIRSFLDSNNSEIAVMPMEPTSNQIGQLIDSQQPKHSGFFKRVYETEQKVVKLPDYPGAIDCAEEHVQKVKNRNIAPETNVKNYDLTEYAYTSKTPVVIQEKYDFGVEHTSNIDEFIDGTIQIIDNALQHDIVLQDAKITNFGYFSNGIRSIDICDKESLNKFPSAEERSLKEDHLFLRNIRWMYDSLVRSVSENSSYSKQQAIRYVTQKSSHLNPEIEIDLPDHSLHTGLEQRLNSEEIGLTETAN